MSVLKFLAADGFLTVNKHLAKIVGLDAAVLMAELASTYNYYESTDQLTDDGMFFETVERIEENTTLTKYQQAKAIKTLVDAGVLETCKMGIPAKRYFKIDENALLALVDHKKSKNFTTDGQKTEPLDGEKLDRNNNIEKEKKRNNRSIFIAPTVDQVADYCRERGNNVDPVKFVSYYESNGWHVGRNKMKDWKAAVRTWERNSRSYSKPVNRKAAELDEFYRMAGEFAQS